MSAPVGDEAGTPMFVRRPVPGSEPLDQVSVEAVPISELKESVALGCRLRRFDREGDPLAAIEAFLLTHQEGIYPPLAVLEFMADAFQKWHDSKGQENLDQCFGVKPGRGQQPIFKEALRRERDQNIMLDVWRLRGLFNVSIEDAAVMVSRRMEQRPWDETGMNLGDLSAETIIRQYRDAGWAELFERCALPQWTNTQRTEFLALFPSDSHAHLSLT